MTIQAETTTKRQDKNCWASTKLSGVEKPPGDAGFSGTCARVSLNIQLFQMTKRAPEPSEQTAASGEEFIKSARMITHAFFAYGNRKHSRISKATDVLLNFFLKNSFSLRFYRLVISLLLSSSAAKISAH